MNAAGDLPAWAALLTAVLVLVGAAVTLIGSLGLLRLATFYARVHAPTLGTTLGMACILAGSALFFSPVINTSNLSTVVSNSFSCLTAVASTVFKLVTISPIA